MDVGVVQVIRYGDRVGMYVKGCSRRRREESGARRVECARG